MLHAVIRQHLDIKRLHRGIDRRSAAELVIQTVLPRRVEVFAAGVSGKGVRSAFIDDGALRVRRLASDGTYGVYRGFRRNAGGIRCDSGIDEEGNNEAG